MARSESGDALPTMLSSLSQLSLADPCAVFRVSDALLESFRAHLQTSTQSMLSSYTHALPDGTETGSAVALDLGGSTLRVGVIVLRRQERIKGSDGGQMMSVIERRSWAVGDQVKRLRARKFFDWIAGCVAEVLRASGCGNGQGMSMGVTWSFPVEQTNLASGKVQKMGKGYEQWTAIEGTDLKSHFDAAFRRRGTNLKMTALMNDTEATLISHAYTRPATGISVIWGTGINAAVYLPLGAISSSKLGQRPRQWIRSAKAVLVNTEVSMYGAGIFPMSQADLKLDLDSTQPGFQPLEQLTGGRYLGEICRLIMIDAAQQGFLFDGQVPEGMEERFTFETASMSAFEEDDITRAVQLISKTYTLKTPLSVEDISSIRTICKAVSARAALYLAITLFTLYKLQRDALPGVPSPALPGSRSTGSTNPVAIAYCGTVAEKHPTARKQCQEALDVLVDKESGQAVRRRLVLEAADDSGVFGAAVGAVMNCRKDIATLKL